MKQLYSRSLIPFGLVLVGIYYSAWSFFSGHTVSISGGYGNEVRAHAINENMCWILEDRLLVV